MYIKFIIHNKKHFLNQYKKIRTRLEITLVAQFLKNQYLVKFSKTIET